MSLDQRGDDTTRRERERFEDRMEEAFDDLAKKHGEIATQLATFIAASNQRFKDGERRMDELRDYVKRVEDRQIAGVGGRRREDVIDAGADGQRRGTRETDDLKTDEITVRLPLPKTFRGVLYLIIAAAFFFSLIVNLVLQARTSVNLGDFLKNAMPVMQEIERAMPPEPDFSPVPAPPPPEPAQAP
ncbi:hypothetical protein K8I61_17130 [bacterium]|nr:hypothetical protein [bacterium]